jgi:hypothetical protein
MRFFAVMVNDKRAKWRTTKDLGTLLQVLMAKPCMKATDFFYKNIPADTSKDAASQ